MLTGSALENVEILLPRGQRPSFSIENCVRGANWAQATVIKDAGDDPDVTHGARIISRVELCAPGEGVLFAAGEGVGKVTKPGLALPPGEPAINPMPRCMMRQAIGEVAEKLGHHGAVRLTLSIEKGAVLAERTLNPRLGIVGGLSILGTTGIVRPFSCSAWIASIHRGVDVARAMGLTHLVGTTGACSEDALRNYYALPQEAFLEMGDFVGGLLKYLRRHSVAQLTLAGGPGKITKLAQGALDLHAYRSQVDFSFLAACLEKIGAPAALCVAAQKANTAAQVFTLAQNQNWPLAQTIAKYAAQVATQALQNPVIQIEVIIVARTGALLGSSSTLEDIQMF